MSPAPAHARSGQRRDEDGNLTRAGSARKRQADPSAATPGVSRQPPMDRHPGAPGSARRLVAEATPAGAAESARGEARVDPRAVADGEKALERRKPRRGSAARVPQPAPGASADPPAAQTPEGGSEGTRSRGATSGGARPAERCSAAGGERASEGHEPQERYRGETNPGGHGGRQGAERLRKPAGAARRGRQPRYGSVAACGSRSEVAPRDLMR